MRNSLSRRTEAALKFNFHVENFQNPNWCKKIAVQVLQTNILCGLVAFLTINLGCVKIAGNVFVWFLFHTFIKYSFIFLYWYSSNGELDRLSSAVILSLSLETCAQHENVSSAAKWLCSKMNMRTYLSVYSKSFHFIIHSACKAVTFLIHNMKNNRSWCLQVFLPSTRSAINSWASQRWHLQLPWTNKCNNSS